MSPDAPLITEIASGAVLERAYAWLCARRRDYSANDDVWNVRRRWPSLKAHRSDVRIALIGKTV